MTTSKQFPQNSSRGFTLVEVMVAMSIAVLAGGLFVVFALMTSKSVMRITNQAELNDSASNTALLIVQRTRAARLAEVTEKGSMLTLTFDDDIETDTDEDGNFFNDSDHLEVFRYYDKDGDLNTIHDNGISYQNIAGAAPRVLVSNIQKIGDAAVFQPNLANPRRIEINFEMSEAKTDGPPQRLEIATSAYSVN